MTGQKFVGLAAACVYLLTLVAGCDTTAPHIVFIVADDLGWNDVGWHNPQMITPNLDKLAKAGVILNSSYVQPLCTPSRNAFLTGVYPFHTGLQHFVILPTKPSYLPLNFTTLPEKLKDLGYTNHMVGKWHLGFCKWNVTPTYRGFDSFLGYYNGAEDYYAHNLSGLIFGKGLDFRDGKVPDRKENGNYSAHVFAKRAIDIIRSHDKTKPLFLYLPFQSVHSPLEVPEKYENMYKSIETKNRRIYCGMVSALDEAVGNITQALEDNGFMDNLLIVFTTDNGGPTYQAANNLPLRGAKSTLWEGGTKGAAFVYSQTLLQKTGYVNTEIMHAVDWFPTILSAAGGKKALSSTNGIDGMDQWDMLCNGKESPRKEFVYNIDEISKNAAIRLGDFKLIEGSPGLFNGWYPLPKLDNDVRYKGVDVRYRDVDVSGFDEDELIVKMASLNEMSSALPKYQLFNISADPTEHFNVADKFPDVVSQLKARLDFWRKSLVPAQNPAFDLKADPKYFDGVWTPGWC